MRNTVTVCILIMGMWLIASSGPGSNIGSPEMQPAYRGFSPLSAKKQFQAETAFLSLPDSSAFRKHLLELTRRPHPAGSPANFEVADYIARTMKQTGFTVEVFEYDVYLPEPPETVSAAVVTPIRLPLNNQEYILKEDPSSGHPELGPAWNAYSGNGDVTAQVVYANYGRKEDFEQLSAMGISLEGKIAIARYGGNFRGFKALYAESAGAAGLIIYSDPEDGGYVKGPPYPEGPYLNESTIQRGSLLTLPYRGDPLTPFHPAVTADDDPDVERLDPETLPFHSIPVVPLPYGSAQEILNRMTGLPVPSDWQGGLPFAYRLTGGDELTVRVVVKQKFKLSRIRNVIGTLEGKTFPDEWVLLGCHYDAWSFGAVDPNCGTAMLLTLAGSLGRLADDGFRPNRTIKIAHWDAEEPGIIGSVEWVEQFREELTAKAVAYINADAAAFGPKFSASTSPSLKDLTIEATKSVAYPGTGLTVFDHWSSQEDNLEEIVMRSLGGGSDHVGFYGHLGIPSASLGFTGSAPIYHSNYDSFHWYATFGDPGFVFGPALAKVDGLIALRLANADVIPYDTRRYATDLKTHLGVLIKQIKEQENPAEFNLLFERTDTLAATAERWEEALDRQLGISNWSAQRLTNLNQSLIGLERTFLYPPGLQGRPWYRNLFGAPDPYNGYAAWVLPGLKQEVETGLVQIEEWKKIYGLAIEELSSRIDSLSAEIR